MQEPIALILIILLSIVTFPFYLLVVRACLPLFDQQVQMILQRSPGRSLVIGFVNLLFWGIAVAIFGSLTDSGAGIFAIPAIGILAMLLLGLTIGLGAISQMVGEMWFSDRPLSRRTLMGALAVTLAILTPFLGWFLLLPLLGTAGIGAAFMNWLARLQSRRKTVKD